MPGNKLDVKETPAAGFLGSGRQFVHHWRMLRDHVPFRFTRSPQAEMCGLTAIDPIRIVRSRILISISETFSPTGASGLQETDSKNRSNWGGKATLS
jgi:hypothetical protein